MERLAATLNEPGVANQRKGNDDHQAHAQKKIDTFAARYRARENIGRKVLAGSHPLDSDEGRHAGRQRQREPRPHPARITTCSFRAIR